MNAAFGLRPDFFLPAVFFAFDALLRAVFLAMRLLCGGVPSGNALSRTPAYCAAKNAYRPRDFNNSARDVSRSGLRLWTDMMRSASRFSRSMFAANTCVPTTGGFGTGPLASVGRLNMSA